MVKKKKKKAAGREKKAAAQRPSLADKATPPHGLLLRYQIGISMFILIAGLCVLYPELVFQNKVFVAGDVESAASLATPIQKGMNEGEYPQWNPYLFSGMPSYESLSYNPHVYPVGWLTGFLSTYLRFPGFTWLLFHILLLGVGVWLLLMERRVHFLIAAGAGILIMWMPNHVAVGVHGHGSQASAVGFMPFALLFWDRLWRGKGVLLNASVLAILLGIQLLRAHIQICYYTFGLLGLHLIFFGSLRVWDAFRGKSGNGEPRPFRSARASGEGSPSSIRRAALLDVGGAAGVLAVVVVASLLVSAVLLLPVHDYSQYSIRGAAQGGGLDYDYATSWSLHPVESLTFIIPFAFGFGKAFYYGYMPFTDYPNYLGVVVVIFALVAVFVVRTRFCWFLVFLVLVSTLVAFGKFVPLLYDPLFKFLPYFNKFRVPVMVLIVQQLAVVLLFAMGLSATIGYDAVKGRRRATWALAAAAGVLAVAVISHGYWNDGFANSIAGRIRNVRSPQEQIEVARMVGGFLFTDLIKFSLLLLSTAALSLLFFSRVLKVLPFVLLILAVGLLDLYLVNRHIVHPERLFRAPQLSVIKDQSEAKRFQKPDRLIEFLQTDRGHFRIFPMTHPSAPLLGDFRSNRYMNFALSSIGGYHPAKLSIYEEFLQALANGLPRGKLQMVNMLNVRYLLTDNPLPESAVFKEAWQGPNFKGEKKYVYENLTAFPRVFFVKRFEIASGREALDRMVTDDGLDLSQTALLEKPPSIMPVSNEGATARITKYGFNEIQVEASLPAPALLVLSEVYYPRWRAWVNGEPTEIIRANHVLRAVALEAGDHELVFRYDRSLLKKSLMISVATSSLALCVLLVAVTFKLRDKVKWKHSS